MTRAVSACPRSRAAQVAPPLRAHRTLNLAPYPSLRNVPMPSKTAHRGNRGAYSQNGGYEVSWGATQKVQRACPWINIVGAMADPHELPPEYRCVFLAADPLRNTTKPIMFWFHDRALARFLLELFTIVAGSEGAANRYALGRFPAPPVKVTRHGAFESLELVCCQWITMLQRRHLSPRQVPAIGGLAIVGSRLCAICCIGAHRCA
jgi:hypothetical protein